MFGRRTLQDEYAKTIAEIGEGQRREPQHDVPVAAQSSWGTVDPIDQLAFQEFAWFGATLDWSTDDEWSFEETGDTRLRAAYLDSPNHGRRWVVYYNSLQLGWVEVSAAPLKLFGTVDDYRASPQARVDMELSLMRFIPAGAAFSILYQTSFFMQSSEGGYEAARERARLAAESAMTWYMWEVMRIGDRYVPDLQFQAEGSYDVFRNTVASWKETGFSPLEHKKRKAQRQNPSHFGPADTTSTGS